MLDWHLDAQKALDLPNFVNYNGPSVLEEGYFSADLIQELESRGHIIRTGPLTSGLHAIQVLEDGTLYGGADPRREGNVMGERRDPFTLFCTFILSRFNNPKKIVILE